MWCVALSKALQWCEEAACMHVRETGSNRLVKKLVVVSRVRMNI